MAKSFREAVGWAEAAVEVAVACNGSDFEALDTYRHYVLDAEQGLKASKIRIGRSGAQSGTRRRTISIRS